MIGSGGGVSIYRLACIVVAFVLVFVHAPTLARASTWTRSFGTSTDESAARIELTPEGGFVLLLRAGPSSDRAAVIRLAPDGTTEWQRVVEGSDSGFLPAWDVLASADGGMWILGTANVSGPSQGDVLVLRLDALGSVVWQKTYDSGAADRGVALTPGPGGDVFVTATRPEPWVLRLDASGAIVFQRSLTGFGVPWIPPTVKAIAPSADGGAFVTGAAVFDAFQDGWLAKLDGEGNIAWAYRYLVDGVNSPFQIEATADGGSALLDFFNSSSQGGQMTKLSALGEVEWRVAFDPDRFTPAALDETAGGEFLVAGYRQFPDWDAAMLRLAPGGAISAPRAFGVRAGREAFFSVRSLGGEGSVLAGFTDFLRPEGNGNDAWVVKVDTGGSAHAACEIETALDSAVQLFPATDRISLSVNVASTAAIPVDAATAVVVYGASVAECARADHDGDLDGIRADGDNCPSTANPAQADADGDRVGDACDVCIIVADARQANADGDVAGDACDCAPLDASVWADVNDPPVANDTLRGMRTSAAGDVQMHWTSLDPVAGPATRYDVVRGNLSSLRAAGFPAGAACASAGLGNTPYGEAALACTTPAGDGCWYLERGLNACGTQSYADSSQTQGAHALDGASVCP